MKIFIILLLLTNVRHAGNPEITNLITNSNIPQDCKMLYLAVTIKESGWHRNKKAVFRNNYSGFITKKGLKVFTSLSSYQLYVEKWFKRKHIRNHTHLYNLLKSGRYCRFRNKEEKYIYMNSIDKIQKQI